MPVLIREPLDRERFSAVVEPHLDAAYNLARWLVRDPDDALDMAQEACVRALRYFASYRGGDARGWLLRIVRNTCFTWLEEKRGTVTVEYNDEIDHPSAADEAPLLHEVDPALLLIREADSQALEVALMTLSPALREVLVLRELEDMSYKQIAAIAGVPIGTVMSRLARARAKLQDVLVAMEKHA